MVEAIAAAITATTSLVSTGITAAEKDKEFQRANTCVFDYEKKANKYREKMWATPIFTAERVEYEGKANAWQKKADEARIKGCPAKASDQIPADMAITPPATDNTLTYLVGGLGLAALVGMGIYLARSR
jgi:hypothetical protein